MHADENRLVGIDLTQHQGHMIDMIDVVLEDDRLELAKPGWHVRDGRAMHELLGSQSIGNQIFDRDDLEIMFFCEDDEVWQSRHRPIVVHDFADHTRRTTARQTSQVDRAFGLADAPKHTARPGTDREYVTRANDIGRLCVRSDRGLNRTRTVGCRDPGTDAFACFDRDRERRSKRSRVLVVRHHLVEMEQVHPFFVER